MKLYIDKSYDTTNQYLVYEIKNRNICLSCNYPMNGFYFHSGLYLTMNQKLL